MLTKKISSAVILAAGMGTRLREIVGRKPKGLLEIAGKAIIKQSLDCLLRNEIDDIVLVVGYKKEEYQKALERDYPFVRYVVNPDYASTGSMSSLFLAEKLVDDDFLLLESDLLYEDRCVSSLLEANKRNIILLSGPTGAGDEVYVYGEDQRITLIAKERRPELSLKGELVGIQKISGSLYRQMCLYYKENISFPSDFHYEDCLSDICGPHEINYLTIPDILWTEIDDPSHYERALNEIYPKIQASRRYDEKPRLTRG